jgi:hypothetical protein
MVEHAGEEAALPEASGKALGGVAVGGIDAVDVHHEEGDGVGPVAGGDEVTVLLCCDERSSSTRAIRH